jgi:hypothetical protein
VLLMRWIAARPLALPAHMPVLQTLTTMLQHAMHQALQILAYNLH